ncbi:MAG: hypothetical protein K6L73_12080 [Cellvibrionaceae bacterium]
MNKRKDSSGVWLQPVMLSDDAKKLLSQIINAEIDSEIFNNCANALCRSAELQQCVERDRPSPAELKKAMTSLEKSFSRVLKVLGEIPGDEERLLDQYHYLITNDIGCMALPVKDNCSNFYETTENMLEAVRLYSEDINPSIKEKFVYTFALSNFKKKFEALFPNNKPSREPESLFHQLVVFWFNECLGHPIVDASRHIDKLFNPLINAPLTE